MPLCQFEIVEVLPDGKSRLRCAGCAAEILVRAAATVRRVCRVAPIGHCQFLGAFARLAPCPTCRGNVQVKVYDCALLGQSTLSRAVAGVSCCATCAHFQSRESSR